MNYTPHPPENGGAHEPPVQTGNVIFNSTLPKPSDGEVVMPEYFKISTLKDLLPGDTIFPFFHVVTADDKTGKLFLDTSREMRDEDRHPPYTLGGHVGLMRVFATNPESGELIDGFVADFRHVKPGSITTETLAPPENASEVEGEFNAQRRSRLAPILAAVFIDPYDNRQYIGPDTPMLIDSVIWLMNATDNALPPKNAISQF